MARNVEFNEEEAIQKAMEVFWKKGYSGASLRDLTDAMKINSSSLYNTIGDKHQLFVKCIKNYTETRMDDARKRAANTKSPLAALVNLINDSATAIINGEDSCMAIKTTFEVAASDKSVQAILKADSDFIRDFLHLLITNARKSGELAEGENAEILADYLLSLLTGWHESYIIHRDPVRIRKMAQFVINQITK